MMQTFGGEYCGFSQNLNRLLRISIHASSTPDPEPRHPIANVHSPFSRKTALLQTLNLNDFNVKLSYLSQMVP
jgi:hypothetical protein